MLERKTLLDQVEITRDGTIQVRLLKCIVDGEEIVAQQYHRTILPPGVDPSEQLAALNANLLQMGEAAVDREDWARVERSAEAEHTEDVVAAHREREALARAQAAADVDAAEAASAAILERKQHEGRKRVEAVRAAEAEALGKADAIAEADGNEALRLERADKAAAAAAEIEAEDAKDKEEAAKASRKRGSKRAAP